MKGLGSWVFIFEDSSALVCGVGEWVEVWTRLTPLRCGNRCVQVGSFREQLGVWLLVCLQDKFGTEEGGRGGETVPPH